MPCSACQARMVHRGRTTQLWGAGVKHEEAGKVIALFRCTRSAPWPKA